MKYIATTLLLLSCSTAPAPLRLQDRTLLLDEVSASLIYPMTVVKCKHPDRRIFRKCKSERKIIKYDLKDERVRSNLIHAGFKCRSSMRFKY